MRTRTCPQTIVLMVLVVAVTASPLVAADRGDVAATILKVTGVQGGLVVHAGCGDGELTAALRINESYVVHGLDIHS